MESIQLSEQDIAFVDELVRKAGQMALEMRDGVGVHTKTGPNDLVTDADLTISRMLISELRQRFPQDIVLSEEDLNASEQCESGDVPRVWLIDPIDGTENYVKRDGQYSSMIGLLYKRQPYYGWIYQPTTRMLFSGGPQFGSTKAVGDGPRLAYGRFADMGERSPIRLIMGWGDRRRFPWVMNLPGVKLVPSQSLGLKIVKILEDEADVFVSLTGRVKLWDTAAPAAIALGAGLDVGTAEGEQLPYPLPCPAHGSSIIIGRPGALDWAQRYIQGRDNHSVPKAAR
jgi:3'(2'), 5'-bisphosphate nucleotidase